MARNGFPVPGRETSSMPLRADELQLPRAGIQRSGWSPGIRGTPAGRLLSRAAGKNRAARRQKTVAKQLITSLKNRPFYHLLHRKGGQLPDEKCDALPLRAENCLCRRAGIQTWRWRNGQPGSSGWLPCVLSRRKESWSWKGSLPRKVRSSLTCRHILLTCGINTAARSCSGDGDGFSVLYLLDVGVMNVPVP